MNASVQVQLNEPVSVVSVGASAITVTAGNTVVAGAVTVSSDGLTVTFKPSGSLATSTQYTVKASGFTDLAGNAVTPFTSVFTTSNVGTLDNGPLTVSSFSPASGATNVAVTSPVTVTFNEAVDPVSVNSNSVNVQANGNTVAGTYAVNGAVVTFTPQTPFPAGANVRVYVDYYAYVTDLAGNSGGYDYRSSFTTAATVDKTAPTVLSVVPAKGATGVGQYGQIVVTFSKSMNPSTLNSNNISLLANGNGQYYNISRSADNRTLTLYNLGLPASTVVTLVITHNVTDLSGNALADFESQFTTAAAADTSRASVVNQRPGNGSTDVPANTSILLYLNKALNAATVPGALHVTANGQVVNGAVTVVGNGQTVEFVPSAALPYGGLIQVFLDTTALDTVGNAVNSYSSSFTIMEDPAVTAPAVVNVSPLSAAAAVPLNAVIHVQYSEALNAATVTAQSVVLRGNGQNVVAATLGLDATGMIVQLAPSAPLAANTQYCYSVNSYYTSSSVQGSNGLTAQGYYACFTTGAAAQGTAPTVKAVSPANGLSNVPVNANIDVLFSGPVDPTTVNATTIQVTGGNQTLAPYSISFTNNDQTVLIQPLTPLPAATAMTLTIAGVKDPAGNAVAVHTTHFTTGNVADTVSPVAMAVNPVPNETNVPVNAAISLQSSAPIDPATINSNTFQLYDRTLGTYVSGTYSQSSDGTTLFLLPSTQLAVNRNYSVFFDSRGMADLAGNGLTCCGSAQIGNYTFATSYSASTTAPQVTGVSPANGVQGVPINAHLTIQFNEAVDEESLSHVTLTSGGNTGSGSQSLSNGNQTLTLTPAAELLQNTRYVITVAGVTDLAGNAMAAPVTSSFTSGTAPDFLQPSVVTIDPGNGSTNVPTNPVLRVQFNKQVAETASNFTLYPYYGGAATGLNASVSTDGRSVTLTPGSALEDETIYCLSVSGVVDLEGQNLAQNGERLTCFTTGIGAQGSGPQVVSVSPANTATECL